MTGNDEPFLATMFQANGLKAIDAKEMRKEGFEKSTNCIFVTV